MNAKDFFKENFEPEYKRNNPYSFGFKYHELIQFAEEYHKAKTQKLY